MQIKVFIIFVIHVSLISCQPRWDLVNIGIINFAAGSKVVNHIINVNSKGAINGISIVFDNPVDIDEISGNIRISNQKNTYDKSFVFMPRLGNWTGKKNEIVLITGAEIPPGLYSFQMKFTSSIDTNTGYVYVVQIFKGDFH